MYLTGMAHFFFVVIFVASTSLSAQSNHVSLREAEEILEQKSGAFGGLVDREGRLRFRATPQDLRRLLIKVAGIGRPVEAWCGNDDLQWKRQMVLTVCKAMVAQGAPVTVDAIQAAIKGMNPETLVYFLERYNPPKNEIQHLVHLAISMESAPMAQSLFNKCSGCDTTSWAWGSWLTRILERPQNAQEEVVRWICVNGRIDLTIRWREFFSAAEHQLDEPSREMILRAMNLNPKDQLGFMPPAQREIIEAITQSDAGSVRQAISRGAQVNLPDAQGRTPLLIAVSGGNVELVQLLLDCDADPYQSTFRRSQEGTALHLAAFLGRRDLLEIMLKPSYAKGRSIKCSNCPPPVCWAIIQGHGALSQWLLEHGTEKDRKCSPGDRVSAAASGGHLELVKELSAHIASPYVDSGNSWNREYFDDPFVEAAMHGHVHILEWYGVARTTKEGYNLASRALIKAAEWGQPEVIRWLSSHCQSSIQPQDAEQAMHHLLSKDSSDLAAIVAPMAYLSKPRNLYQTHELVFPQI